MRMSDRNLKRLATVTEKEYSQKRYHVTGVKTRCYGAKAVTRIVNNVRLIAKTALSVYVPKERPKVPLEVNHIPNGTEWL